MKPQDIRNMTEAEIENKLNGLKEELFKIKAEVSTGRIERPHRFQLIKKDIARFYTILKEKKSESTK
ncbi:MAG: 50S ribosomal protein L29 [Candidatus Omnitrophica bacterium]|nr:50S ribosomal protein L29 [Candidatus Omnitrophota bacterium]